MRCMMEANIQKYGGNSVVVRSDNIATITPNIENINVNKSTKVHIGPKFVSVTQNVNNVEVVRGRFLGLRLVSTKHPGRLSCSVAVFICWSIVVASALIVYIVHVALPKPTKMDLDLKGDWYFRREEWQAMQAYAMEFYQLPLQYVIIGHAATGHCDERFECTRIMLMIQEDHLRRNLGDIGPNFLVGGNGLVFEGRGANVVPAMVRSWNRKSMMIMFIGNYVNDKPDQLQFDHVNVVLQTLVRQGVLRSDYILYGQCQVQTLTVPPGPEIMHRLDNFEHWDPVNATSYCLSGKDRG